jgi:hypothetical protein
MRRVEVSSSPGPSPFSHSPECVEEEFCELRIDGVLRSSPNTISRKLRQPF